MKAIIHLKCKMNIVDRFLKYVSFCTTSDENTNLTPSTPGQMEFARYLADELREIGMQDVSLDSNGYIMATLPSNQQSAISRLLSGLLRIWIHRLTPAANM